MALTAAKHGGLKEADGSSNAGCRFSQTNQPPAAPSANGETPRINIPVLSFDCKNVTMGVLASTLASAPSAQGYFQGKPVVDRTGLQGSWDFSFRYTPKLPAAAQVAGESISMTEAMEKQLGLKLELSTVLTPVVAIDSVDEKPAPNPANLAEILPPAPTEFEVAVIKASSKNGPQPNTPGLQIQNGRFVAIDLTIRRLVQIAWGQTRPELLAGPHWMDDEHFDIIAKAPSEVAIGDLDNPSARSSPLNIDALRPMLRALLISRFKIEFHMEDRLLNAMTLTAPNPKLTKAGPSERTKWSEGTAGADPKNAKNAYSTFGRLVTCQNVSMAQFVEMLPQIAGGYVQSEVRNNTGLEGGWDFAFSFSPLGLLNQQAGNRDPGEVSDPNGAISLQEALMKQLGLKLDTEKRPVPVLVIDKIEKTPTEN